MLRSAQLQRARVPGEEATSADAQTTLLSGGRMGLVRRFHCRRRADTEPRITISIWRTPTDRIVQIRNFHLQNRR